MLRFEAIQTAETVLQVNPSGSCEAFHTRRTRFNAQGKQRIAGGRKLNRVFLEWIAYAAPDRSRPKGGIARNILANQVEFSGDVQAAIVNEKIADTAIGALFRARRADIRPQSVLVLGDIGSGFALRFVEQSGYNQFALVNQHIADAVVECLDGAAYHFPVAAVPTVKMVNREGRSGIGQHTAGIKCILVNGYRSKAVTALVGGNYGRRIQARIIRPVQSVPAGHFVLFLESCIVGCVQYINVIAFLPGSLSRTAQPFAQWRRHLPLQRNQASETCHDQPALHLFQQITPFFVHTGHGLVNTVLKVELNTGLLWHAAQR